MHVRLCIIATGILLAACGTGAARPQTGVVPADVDRTLDRHAPRVHANFPSDSALHAAIRQAGLPSTPPAMSDAMSDTVYRSLCEPPFDRAGFARNGCILRDQGLQPDARPVAPPKPSPLLVP